MIKRAHECPKSIFKQVQDLTDYDYFLVHLFETDPEYFQLAKEAVASGREVCLDSSTFELGKAFDMERYTYWIRELKPTYYIIPDALDDMEKTKALALQWLGSFATTVPGHMIGVVQGKNFEECAHLYTWFDKQFGDGDDKIAFSFDSKWYEDAYPYPNKLVSWCFGRIFFINRLLQTGILNKNRKHHLLGCSIPDEFKYYSKPCYSFLDSVDTSNPVLFGLKGERYSESGMNRKWPDKMCDLMNIKLGDISYSTWDDISFNVSMFKTYCKLGWY